MKDKKIMVVDGNEDVIFLVKTALEREGYRVMGVTNSQDCLEKVVVEKPDLILMDVTMPSIDGWEVCRRIKESELLLSVPISMLNILRKPGDIKKSLEYAGDDAHLGKPLSVEELRSVVRELLGED
jgi:CheY-like chemotaxis protein